MTAVAEEREAYTMPKVAVGQPVQWFNNADTSRPKGALVARASDRSISVVTYSGQLIEQPAVRHLSDPDLKNNERLRAFGAWDYLPMVWQEDGFRKEVAELKQLVSRLSDRLANLERNRK